MANRLTTNTVAELVEGRGRGSELAKILDLLSLTKDWTGSG